MICFQDSTLKTIIMFLEQFMGISYDAVNLDNKIILKIRQRDFDLLLSKKLKWKRDQN